MTRPAAAQTGTPSPAISYRVVAIPGNDPFSDDPVWEPEIAAGPDRVFAVCNYRPRGENNRGAYGVAQQQSGVGWVWEDISTEQVPPIETIPTSFDYSVALDAVNGDFVIASGHLSSSVPVKNVAVLRYGNNSFGSWIIVHEDAVPQNIDKPYIITGTPLATAQEFYLVWQAEEATNFRYARSIDGGSTWFTDQVKVGGAPVQGNFSIQPAYADADTIHACYNNTNKIRFLEGTDDNTSGNSGVTWQKLTLSNGNDLQVTLRAFGPTLNSYIPGEVVKNMKSLGSIVADPTNTDRLFVFYHDITTAAGSKDVDVFCSKLVRSGSSWSVASTTRVNTDSTSPEHDQFNPSACIDSQGRLHVVFMDDRNHTQDDNAAEAKFDAYYAISYNAGTTFQNYRLNDADANPAFDESVWNDPNPSGEFGEYMGIDEHDGTVWVVFPGTLDTDTGHKSVIWSARIVP